MNYSLERASSITGVPVGHLELWTDIKVIMPAAEGFTPTNLLEAALIKTLVERGLGMPLIQAIMKKLQPRRKKRDFFDPAVLQAGDGTPCFVVIGESFKQVQEFFPPATIETDEDFERLKEHYNPTLPRDFFYTVDVFFADIRRERDVVQFLPDYLTSHRQVMIINLFALSHELGWALGNV